MKTSGVLVKTKTGKKGYVYYKSIANLEEPKLQVHIVDSDLKKTGEKLLCESKSLTAVGFVD